MPPKKPKDIPDKKLKCFTRKDKEGKKYVNCQDKTKMKAPAKKAPAKKKLKVVPKKASAKASAKAPAKKAPAKKPSATPPKPPPANFNMLRPEIRRNVLEFSGVVKNKFLAEADRINYKWEGDGRINKDTQFTVLDQELKKLLGKDTEDLGMVFHSDWESIISKEAESQKDRFNKISNNGLSLGQTVYYRVMKNWNDRLNKILANRKAAKQKQSERNKKERREAKEEKEAELKKLGFDNKREFNNAKDVRDYMKFDKEFAKKFDELFKAAKKIDKVNDAFDNSTAKIKNYIIREMLDDIIPSSSSYNQLKEFLNRPNAIKALKVENTRLANNGKAFTGTGTDLFLYDLTGRGFRLDPGA